MGGIGVVYKFGGLHISEGGMDGSWGVVHICFG